MGHRVALVCSLTSCPNYRQQRVRVAKRQSGSRLGLRYLVCATLFSPHIVHLNISASPCCNLTETEHFFLVRDNWARTISPNANVKIYLGAPASSTAAGTGYQAIDTLSSVAVKMRKSFPSFGGVMLWDASQAYGKPRCYARNFGRPYVLS